MRNVCKESNNKRDDYIALCVNIYYHKYHSASKYVAVLWISRFTVEPPIDPVCVCSG